jgi:universal stress protein A
MSTYKTVLVAIDLEGGSEQVLEKTAALLNQDGLDADSGNHPSKLVILNVGHFPMPTYAGVYGEGLYSAQELTVDFNSMRAHILPQLEEAASAHSLPGKNTELEVVVEFGRPADLILDVAERESADLIVMGSHGKHGIRLILGSTANSVLHHAKCDVLAVRIDK